LLGAQESPATTVNKPRVNQPALRNIHLESNKNQFSGFLVFWFSGFLVFWFSGFLVFW